jgi:hypothetical protein
MPFGREKLSKKSASKCTSFSFFSPKYYQKVVLLMDVMFIGIVLEL